MGREIKFRQWCVSHYKNEKSGFWYSGWNGYEWVAPLKSVDNIQQFTGLRDKNRRDVYEGDIVGHLIISGHKWAGIHEVVFDSGSFLLKGGTPYGMLYGEIFNWYLQNVEVIGNIYENPSLLEAA